jgi:hypothetical protein
MESLLYQHYHKGASKMTTSQHHEQLSRILAALALLYAKQGEIYANWTPDKQVELEQVRSEIEALERQYEEAQK